MGQFGLREFQRLPLTPSYPSSPFFQLKLTSSFIKTTQTSRNQLNQNQRILFFSMSFRSKGGGGRRRREESGSNCISDDEMTQYEFSTVRSTSSEEAEEEEEGNSSKDSFTYIASPPRPTTSPSTLLQSPIQLSIPTSLPSSSPSSPPPPSTIRSPTSAGGYYSAWAPEGYKPVNKYPFNVPLSKIGGIPEFHPASASEEGATTTGGRESIHSRFKAGVERVSSKAGVGGGVVKDEKGWYELTPIPTLTSTSSTTQHQQQQELEQLTKEKLKLKERVEELSTKVLGFEKVLSEKDSLVSEVNKELRELVKALQGNCEQLEDENRNLMRDKEGLKIDKERLEIEVQKVEEGMKKMREEFNKVQDENNAEIRGGKVVQEKLVEKLRKIEGVIEGLRMEIGLSEKEIDRVREEKARLVEKNLALQSSLKSLGVKLNTFESFSEGGDPRLEEAVSQIVKLEDEVKDSRDQIKELELVKLLPLKQALETCLSEKAEDAKKYQEKYDDLKSAHDVVSKQKRELTQDARIKRVQMDVLRAQVKAKNEDKEPEDEMVVLGQKLTDALEQTRILENTLEERRKIDEVIRYSTESLLKFAAPVTDPTSSSSTTTPLVGPIEIPYAGILDSERTHFALAEQNKSLQAQLDKLQQESNEERQSSQKRTMELEVLLDEVLVALQKIEESNNELKQERELLQQRATATTPIQAQVSPPAPIPVVPAEVKGRSPSPATSTVQQSIIESSPPPRASTPSARTASRQSYQSTTSYDSAQLDVDPTLLAASPPSTTIIFQSPSVEQPLQPSSPVEVADSSTPVPSSPLNSERSQDEDSGHKSQGSGGWGFWK